MRRFETECERDHHGNAFKEYFGDKPLVTVNKKTVPEFISWLMQKYAANEATISKKVFAASALFKWMKKKGWWIGENPFSEALSGVKFAPPRQKKDVIEPEELARLIQVLQDDKFRELRILVEILYSTGMRPSEARELMGEKIDVERLALNYLRTKRKNKTPDWRRIPIPARLVSLLVNKGRTKGRIVNLSKGQSEELIREAVAIAQTGGLSLETFRKDFAYRARIIGASVDDVNLYQRRQETILEKHCTTNPWFIVHQCRSWIGKMFGEKPGLQLVK
jgi:integrase